MLVKFDPGAPYEVEESDVPYARPGGQELLARVYWPAGERRTALAGIVDVHGGAWSRLDRTTGALHARALAACGLFVVSLDFRQGPAHRHPAGSADVAAGVRWLRANAYQLGVDPQRIGLLGSSSGGQLALLAALRPGALEHAGVPIVLSNETESTAADDDSAAFVLALYPVADPLARYRYVLRRSEEPAPASDLEAKRLAQRLVEAHRGYFADEIAMAEASATRIVVEGEARALPPVWLAQPEFDDNVPAEITDAFVEAYRAAGGKVERVRFPGARHSFIQQAGQTTDECIALMRDFIARQVQPPA
jgi:acetyl esterase